MHITISWLIANIWMGSYFHQQAAKSAGGFIPSALFMFF